MCHETDEDLWDTTMRINSKSVFLGCKYALAQMMTQDLHSTGDRGWIINISSIMALIGGSVNRTPALLSPLQTHDHHLNRIQHPTVLLKGPLAV